MDNGYPLTTEPNALKEMIPPPSMYNLLTKLATTGQLSQQGKVSETLPDGTISSMPWRKTNVKYSQNEIYLDIIEEMDAIVDSSGQVISAEVNGTIQGNSRLSGLPDLSLTFADPNVIDDCSFHPCVRYNRYERDRTVSFVPPDGYFELMKYRVVNTLHNQGGKGHRGRATNNYLLDNDHNQNTGQNTCNINPPIYCSTQITYGEEHGNAIGRLMLTMGAKATSSLVYSSSSATAGGGSGGGGNGGGAAGLAAGMLSGSKPLPSFEDVVVTLSLIHI